MAHFGFSAAAWTDAKKRGALQQRRPWHFPEKLFAVKTRAQARRMMLAAGVLREECYECGLTHWLGLKLALHVDHINGIANDHRPENLRMLCPNCHSQTATFSGRNIGRKIG